MEEICGPSRNTSSSQQMEVSTDSPPSLPSTQLRVRPRPRLSMLAAVDKLVLISKQRVNSTTDNIYITTSMTERCHLSQFFSNQESDLICSPAGMPVKVLDRFDRSWNLILKDTEENYILTGAKIKIFKRRQQFPIEEGRLYVWVGRTVKDSIVIGIDIQHKAASDEATANKLGSRIKRPQHNEPQRSPNYFHSIGVEVPLQTLLPRPPRLPPHLRPRLSMVAAVAPMVSTYHCPSLVSKQQIKYCDDYRHLYHDFKYSIDFTTTMQETNIISWFLTEQEEDEICSPSGMKVKVIDRYDRFWQLVLKRKSKHGYMLCGPNFRHFKRSQKFQTGWCLYFWIGRIGPDRLYPPIIGMDLRRNDAAVAVV